MTVPIIPGPGAFLEQLGHTGADLINAHTQGQLTTQSLAEHAQALAQQHLTTIMNLAHDGIIPQDSLNHPEIQALVKAAGLPGFSAQANPNDAITAEKNKILATGDADPRYSAISGIEGLDTATKKKQIEDKKLDLDSLQADSEKSILTGMMNELDKNPDFRRLSYSARAGTLSYLTQQLQNQGNVEVAQIHAGAALKGQTRQIEADRFAGLRQLYNNATSIYNEEMRSWAQEAMLKGDDEKWLATHPKPDFNVILNNVKSTTGVKDTDLQSAYSDIINGVKAGTHSLSGTSSPDGGSADGYTGTKLNRTQILNYAHLLQTGQGTLDQLDQAVQAGGLWAKDADAIKAAAGIKTGAKK